MFSRFQELGLVGVIVLLMAVLTFSGGKTERRFRDPDSGREYILVKNKFLNADRLLTLAKNTSFFAIMAIGATIVIVTGGIDLSVAGIYVVSGLAGAAFLNLCGPTGPWNGTSPWLVVPLTAGICLGTGTVCGTLNGAGVNLLGLHPFLVTLGTMGIFRGLAFVTTKAQSIGRFDPAFVDGFVGKRISIGGGESISPVPLVILLLVLGAGTWFLSRTVTGCRLRAIGGNETAARYAGLAIGRLKLWTYALCGLTAGIAAMINIGYHGSAASSDGAGYELEVIAAAVVGGASLSGGRGSALGAVLGALIIRLIVEGIVILDLDQNYSQVIVGAVIIAAATLDRWQTNLRRKLASA